VDTQHYRGFIEVTGPSPGGGGELVSSPFVAGTHALPTAAARLVQGCRTFATLEEHAAGLGRELGLGPQYAGWVRQQLAALARAGFLVSPHDLAEACRRSLPQEPLPRIASVGIPTRDRPALLERCLSGYIESGLRHGRTHDCIVIDDSQAPDVRAANRLLLQSLRRRYGVQLCYAGQAEKARFAEALVRRTGLPADVVEFGLLGGENCPVTTGSSRNALLLHAAGDLLLQVDDDSVCRQVPAPEWQPGLALSSQLDPTAFWFFGKEEALPEGADADFLAAHEDLLGKDPSAWVGGAACADLNCDQANASFFRKLLAAPGRILVTAAGVLGDSGLGSPLYLLSLEGGSRQRLVRCERDYRHALARGRLLRAAPRATVCEGAFCMAVNLGLDHRRLLPPFMPVQRNQDGIFGSLLRACFPDAFFGFLPCALLHLPPGTRSWSEDDLRQSGAVRSGQILQVLIRLSARPAGGEGTDNLRALGKALAELGCAPLPDFEEVVRLHWQKQLSQLAGGLEGRLRQFGGQPAFWADDVRRAVQAVHDVLTQKGPVVAADLREAFGADEARPLLQRLVRRFGQLLQCWPDLVEAAKELRAGGVRLASVVPGQT
jgi:hypothetical protein